MKFAKNLLALGASMVIFYSCKAQEEEKDTECYQNSWAKWIENELPQNICVDKNKMIYHLFNEFDFNKDGLMDIAIKVGNIKRKNGDKRELIIYKQINDTTYNKFKGLENIYPIWFDNYNSRNQIEDPDLNALKQKYVAGNPLRKLEMIDNKIILNLKYDVGYEYIYEFTFNNEKQDWFLSKHMVWDLNEDIKIEEDNGYLNTSISEFNYFKFIAGEY